MTARDFIGQRFGTLVVYERHQGRANVHWRCICDCGRECIRAPNKFTAPCKACVVRKHGHALHGKTSPTYQAWIGAKKRCFNQKCKSFKDYGARGITVCERWLGMHGFEHFLYDMGLRPSADHSVDRIDNSKGYSPDNCRWATRLEQNRNTRGNRLEPHEAAQIRWLFTEGFNGAEIARHFEISQTHVGRIRKNTARVDR